MAERLKDLKGRAKTADDHRRRRMETAVSLRKDKRTEQLQKKRHLNEAGDGGDADASMEVLAGAKVGAVCRDHVISVPSRVLVLNRGNLRILCVRMDLLSPVSPTFVSICIACAVFALSNACLVCHSASGECARAISSVPNRACGD